MLHPPTSWSPTGRRTLLRALVGAGGLAVLAACGGEDGGTPAPSAPAPSGSSSSGSSSGGLTRTPGTPTVPEGLQESQRTAHRYGQHPRQVSDMWLPVDGPTRAGVVVLVHGGAWRAEADRSETDRLVADLVQRGHAVLNVDYRGVGDGGGWAATLADVASAVDVLRIVGPGQGVDADRAVLVGHSAGGHLAMWAAGRSRLPAGAPGASPALQPIGAAAMSGVVHPTALGEREGGDPNVVAFFGGTPGEVPDRYAAGDPLRLLPFGIPLLVAHGTADDVVPPEQSRSFAEAARAAGDDVRLELTDGEGHGTPLYPSSQAWQRTRAFVEDLLA